MIYRKLKLKTDYKPLCELWEKSAMKVAPPIEMLPDNGIVAYHKGEYIGAVFLFMIKHSKVVLIGYPIVNTDYREDDRSDIISQMYLQCEVLAEIEGYTIAQTFSNIPAISHRLEEDGWTIGDPCMDNYIKLL